MRVAGGAAEWVCLAAAPFENQGAMHGVTVRTPDIFENPAALAAIIDLAGSRTLKRCVEHILSFANSARAQRLSESGHARGKTVLVW